MPEAPASSRRFQAAAAAEALALTIFALVFVRAYLDIDPNVVPLGIELPSVVASHHFWTKVVKCGTCAFWNGSLRGGAPALADPLGAILHPMVAVATISLGVMNGAKLALVASFVTAALAQWWLGRVLGLSLPARLWTAAMAVVAGHLGPRMETGFFGVVFSTAACTLILPAFLAVVRRPTRRATAILGLVLGQAALAGQGYLQVGLLLTLPLPTLILISMETQRRLLVRRLILAVGIGLLIAAAFVIPYVHFLPWIRKETAPNFEMGQPLRFLLLNLLIDDGPFYRIDTLQKLPMAGLYPLFIGWIPLALAIAGLTASREQRRASRLFLGTYALLVFWVASAQPMRWVVRLAPGSRIADLASGLRFPSLIAGLAVPAVLALAGLGLDGVCAALRPRRSQGPAAVRDVGSWLLLTMPLVLAVSTAWTFSQQWVQTGRYSSGIRGQLELLRTPDLQWVAAPFGEHEYSEVAAGMGLKLSHGFRGWKWRDRPFPEPILWLSRYVRKEAPQGMSLRTWIIEGELGLWEAGPGREYAAIREDGGERVVCRAQGLDGRIDVACPMTRGGVLKVAENFHDDWRATVDGRPATLEAEKTWLALRVPAGSHTVRLRFTPWDAPVGIVISMVGWVLGIVLVFRRENPPQFTEGGSAGPAA